MPKYKLMSTVSSKSILKDLNIPELNIILTQVLLMAWPRQAGMKDTDWPHSTCFLVLAAYVVLNIAWLSVVRWDVSSSDREAMAEDSAEVKKIFTATKIKSFNFIIRIFNKVITTWQCLLEIIPGIIT